MGGPSSSSSASTAHRRPLTPTVRNVASNGTSHVSAKQAVSSANAAGSRKRARSPCADERAYRGELQSRYDALRQQLAKRSQERADLEQTILSFYIANMVEVESPPPQTTASDSTARLQSRISYYATSAVAQARSARDKINRERESERERLEQTIADLEDNVQRTIVKGVLAEQRAVTEAEEQALAHRQDALRQCQATTTALEEDIAAENGKRPAIEADTEACKARIHTLDERKRKQMENVEQTRQELQRQRELTKEALDEWQRRQSNVAALEKEIERRQRLLKRAKRCD